MSAESNTNEAVRGLCSLPLAVSTLGCAFFIAWFQGTKATFFAPIEAEGLAQLYETLTRTFDLIFLLAIAMLSSKIGSVVSRPRLMVTCAGIIAVAACGLLPGLPVPLAVIAASLQGVARAILALVWMELFSRFGMRRACVGFSLASVLGIVCNWLLDAIPVFSSDLLMGFCGFLSTLLALLLGWPRGTAASALDPLVKTIGVSVADRETETKPWSFPLRPTVLLSVYALSVAVVSLFCDAGAGFRPRGFSTLLAAAAMFVATFMRTDKKGASLIGAASLPLTSLGIIAALVPSLGLDATFLVGLGYQLFATYIYVLLFDLSYRYGINSLWLFGFSRATRVAVALFVPVLAQVFPGIGQGAARECLLVIVLIVLIGVASLYPIAWDSNDTLGIRQVEEKGRDARGRRDVSLTAKSIDDSLERVVYVYGLTKREEEVLGLLAAGMTTTQIEGELSISKGTARNHIRHIYEKTGVHSRDELQRCINEV